MKTTHTSFGFIAACLLSPAVMGDVLVSYTSSADLLLETPAIEIAPADLGVPFTLDVGASSTTGEVIFAGAASFMFDYLDDPDIDLSDFQWNDLFNDSDKWFADSTLPNPVVVTFNPATTFDIPPAPDEFALAAVQVILSPDLALGSHVALNTGAGFFDRFGAFLAMAPASGSVEFAVIPEPAAVILLGIAALWIHRRRAQVRH